MRQLLPEMGEMSLDELAAQMMIVQRPHRGWHVRSNMISTIDGAVRGPSGTSVDMSNDTDRAMLGMLRGISDAVIVGSRNALAQPYLPLPAKPRWQSLRSEHGLAAAPRLVVVTNSGLPANSPCFQPSDNPTIVITSRRCGADALSAMRERAMVIVAGDDSVDFSAALTELANLGLWRVLCEGGPSVLSAMSAANALDEMCVTTAALWSGTAGDAMTAAATTAQQQGVQMRLAHLLIDDEDYLYARWVRATAY